MSLKKRRIDFAESATEKTYTGQNSSETIENFSIDCQQVHVEENDNNLLPAKSMCKSIQTDLTCESLKEIEDDRQSRIMESKQIAAI